jgi:hypothetical protein
MGPETKKPKAIPGLCQGAFGSRSVRSDGFCHLDVGSDGGMMVVLGKLSIAVNGALVKTDARTGRQAD